MAKFFIEMAVDIDPEAWEEAGYDPLDPNLYQQCLQVAEWVKNVQYLGGSEVPTEVRHVRLGSTPRAVNEAPTGFHLMTVSRSMDGDERDELVFENDMGHELSRVPTEPLDAAMTHMAAQACFLLGQDSHDAS